MNTIYDRKKGYYTSKGDEKTTEFEFNTDLPLTSKVSIINDTISLIIDKDEYGQRYHSIIKDTMFKFMVISTMTNIDTSFINEEMNRINAIDHFVNNTNIFDVIVANTGVLVPTLYKSLNDEIASITGVREDISNAITSLIALINSALTKISQFDVDGIMKAAEKISSVDGEVNEKSLVEALIKAKKTDTEETK